MAIVDQGAILRSGAALIPDLQAQLAQQQQLDMQRQQIGLQAAKYQSEQAQIGRELAEDQAYAADVQALSALPMEQQPQAVAALMRKYPKRAEALKKSWDSQDEAAKDANFRSASEMWFLLKNGATDKAAAILRKRVEADRAAGQDVSDDEQVLADLESGDEERVKAAYQNFSYLMQAAAGPDKFASIAGVVDPQTEFQQQYEYIKENFGQAQADNFARNKYDPFIESNNKYGTTFYRSSDLAGGGPAPQQGQTGGGGDTGGNVSGGKGAPVSDAASVAKSLFPDIEITQQRRDPNSSLGKANPSSWHNKSGAAIDVRPIKGMTFAQYVKRFADAGYTILEAKNEVGAGRSKWATGDHWHVVLGGGPKGAAPVRVTSKAQYDKLAPGTTYIAPDGSRRTKS
mgnify:CR=1 FL=1